MRNESTDGNLGRDLFTQSLAQTLAAIAALYAVIKIAVVGSWDSMTALAVIDAVGVPGVILGVAATAFGELAGVALLLMAWYYLKFRQWVISGGPTRRLGRKMQEGYELLKKDEGEFQRWQQSLRDEEEEELHRARTRLQRLGWILAIVSVIAFLITPVSELVILVFLLVCLLLRFRIFTFDPFRLRALRIVLIGALGIYVLFVIIDDRAWLPPQSNYNR